MRSPNATLARENKNLTVGNGVADAFIASLPFRWQAVYIGLWVDGKTHRELASELGVTYGRIGHLKKQIQRRLNHTGRTLALLTGRDIAL